MMTARFNEERTKLLQEWKKLYTEALIDALNPTGNVLEIGFGSGTAAESIQKHHPKSHLIIESNSQTSDEATKWAKQKKDVKVLQGTWQTVLPTLGTFDAIFFNAYSAEYNIALMNFLFPEDALQASEKARQVIELLEEQMAQLTQQFSDKDIEDFYEKIGQFNLKELPRFFQRLKNNGNISQVQYAKVVKKYRLSEPIAKGQTLLSEQQPDEMLLCLEQCLKKHMNPRGRFTAFLNSQISKYEDPQFFDKIITNPNVDYKEISLPIKMSDKVREALVILVKPA